MARALAIPLALAGQTSILTALTGATLFVSLVFGGGTRPGLLSDALLQLGSLPLVAFLIARRLSPDDADPAMEAGQRSETRRTLALALCAGLAVIPALQLLPLPPAVWSRLPGQATVAAGLGDLGGDLPWRSISVMPHNTWLALLSLLAPVSIFVATTNLGATGRRRIAAVLMACGALSLALGLAQIAQGPSSPLRFFAVTSNDVAVGFFANRNHFAALLYVLILLASAWIASASSRVVGAAASADTNERAKPYLALVAGLMLLIALLVAVISTSSRAGLILTMVALVGVYLVTVASPGASLVSRYGRLALALAGLTAVLVGQLALWRLLGRFGIDPLRDARLAFARHTFQSGLDFLPFGSGIGSFVPIYALAERKQDLMIDTYANHAHNDLLQVFLEAGLPGVALLAAALLWIGLACLRLWREAPEGLSGFDVALARAAGFALLLLTAHSVADYPLRTGAMMAVTAFLAALLVPPPAERDPPPPERSAVRASRRAAPGQRRHALPSSVAQAQVAAPLPPQVSPPSVPPGSWPEQWGGGDQMPPPGGRPPDRSD